MSKRESAHILTEAPLLPNSAEKTIGLDSLMNLAGLNSFATDQAAMDQRVQEVLAKR